VRAYEKDPETGIVRHLDDQCIGCQYCTLKCPYDVPKYDAARGIVRKCDMCSDRLGAGEAPACVQGCPTSAITIDVVALGREPAALLPLAAHALPDPAYTRPTTRYVSARPRAALRPANEHVLAPADPHHPLSLMLVLTQLGVGAIAFAAARALLAESGPPTAGLAIGLAATLVGLGVANLHLGRPLYAFRVVLGLRTSWMSREIVALGAFAGAASAFAASALLPPLAALEPWLAVAAAATGVAAVFCSVMIYADTHRPLWRFAHTAPLFALTCVALGAGAACVAERSGAAPALALIWAAANAVKLRFEVRLARHEKGAHWTALKKSALLVAGPLRRVARARATLGWLCGVALPIAAAITGSTPLAAAALAGNACAEWLERQLFFRASAAPTMPGA
jgi:DMSO reductase anchor subunit